MQKSILNQKQELFCKYYTQEGDTFGNATLSYSLAYGKSLEFSSLETKKENIKGYSTTEALENYCAMAGSRLIRNDKVMARIKALLLEKFNADDVIDTRLLEIIMKGKDSDAINAIKHRNDLKQRVLRKIEVKTIDRPLAGLSDAELMAITSQG